MATDPTLPPEPPSATYLLEVLETPRTSEPPERAPYRPSGWEHGRRSFLELEPPPGYLLAGWHAFSESAAGFDLADGDAPTEGRIGVLWCRVSAQPKAEGA